MRRPPRPSGFTLIEILGAFFIMTIILTLITGMFVENGRQRAAALGMMREGLSATAAVEQMAQDLEAAIFVTDELDRRPDEYAWRFLAEDSGEFGARSLRFVTQNTSSSNRAEHAAGWSEVVYFLEEDLRDSGESSDAEAADGSPTTLWRWVSPRPPTLANAGLPRAGDEGTMRIALQVNDLGLRFLSRDGEWLDEWDSAFQSPDLPMPDAVEINLQLMRAARPGESDEGLLQVPGPMHQRRVALPMPPVDWHALVALNSEGAEDESGCFTIADCIEQGDAAWYEDELDDDCGGNDELCGLLSASSTTCWSEIENGFPEVASQAPDTCVQ